MDMAMAMDTMVMERGKLRPLLKLKLMLTPVIIIMVMDTMVDMVMDTDTERGKLMLPPEDIIMVMDTPMVDMVDMATMDMERGRLPPVILIMVMVDRAGKRSEPFWEQDLRVKILLPARDL